MASQAQPDSPRTRIAWLWSTFFGAGYLRPGPGTYGSVAALLLWLGVFHATSLGPRACAALTFAAAVVVTLTGIPAATRVARESGRKDPGFVVIDEVAGQLFALVPLSHNWKSGLLGLVLFRILDITKPWPIRRLEALPEGTGIMLDDVAAGFIAAVLGLLVTLLFPHRF